MDQIDYSSELDEEWRTFLVSDLTIDVKYIIDAS